MTPAELTALVVPLLPPDEPVIAADPEVAAAVEAAGLVSGRAADGPVGATLLLSGEVARAGSRGPGLVADAIAATRAGGVIAVAGPSALWSRLTGAAAAGFTAAQADHLLAERGLDVMLVAGPGAAARLANRPWAGLADLDDDRQPGLCDAGPVVLAVGRTPRTPAERSARFFSSITRKIVAASVVCQDGDGQILVVFDTFKNCWTLPGGLVDAQEAPHHGAAREALEEGGVAVRIGALLGVFAHPHPDAVHFIYAATPTAPTPHPKPIHLHEVSEARWVSRSQAAQMLDPGMARRLTHSLDQPGQTWQW